MRKIFTILLFLSSFAATSFAQTIQLNQSFTAPYTATTNGWYVQNNSSPIGPTTWAQGAGTLFPAYSGGINDYYRINYNTGGPNSDIWNFLITPTVSLMNGGVFQFYTRAVSNPVSFADRVNILMSIGSGTGGIGPWPGDLGTFLTTLDVINPNLTTTGYPGGWTLYSYTLSAISGTQVGRFAFLYDVYDGGAGGSNSNYIGFDDVKYTTAPPCPTSNFTLTPGQSLTICPGNSVALSATGATSYTWYPMVTNGNSVVVNPSSTTVYTVAAKDPTNCASFKSITVTIGPPPTVNTTTAITICPGNNATLTASGANTYSWSNGATGSVNVVAVNGSTTYVVTGSNGPGCMDTETISITSNTFLTISSPTVVACPNQATFIGASGANSYLWNTGATTSSIVVTPTANAVVYSVTGNDGTCNETKYITVNIDPNMYTPSFTTCAGTAATLIATGAQTYSWSTGSTASVAVVTPSANSVYTITGTSGACAVTRTVSVTIGTNLSVIATQSCIGTSLILSAYGANSYTWLPINDNNQSVIVTPTAATVYTLMGKAGTCVGSKTFALTFCAGVNEIDMVNESIVVYPNPFNGELKISNAYGKISVVNMLGEVVLTSTVEESTTLSTELLKNGIYFVIITDPVSIKRKVIKVIKE